MRQDTLKSLDPDALVLGKDLLDTLSDLPVPRSRLDETNSHLGSLVDRSEKVGTDVRDGARGGDDDTIGAALACTLREVVRLASSLLQPQFHLSLLPKNALCHPARSHAP